MGEAGRRAAVPATYAMRTLSSVWAMPSIANLGFSTVFLMGVAGYCLAGAQARRLGP